MRLLKETKMVWLSVYVGNLVIVAALYSLDASFRTIPVIGTIVEVVLLLSFLLMALSGSGLSVISPLAWGFLRHCQIIGSLLYFAASICKYFIHFIRRIYISCINRVHTLLKFRIQLFRGHRADR